MSSGNAQRLCRCGNPLPKDRRRKYCRPGCRPSANRPVNAGVRKPYRDEEIVVTQDNQQVADALIGVYLGGAAHGPVSLYEMARAAPVPLSDLFGAIRRRVAKHSRPRVAA